MRKYYNRGCSRLLLENDIDALLSKSNNTQFRKLIISASAGGAGAISCMKYLKNTFNISSLKSTIEQFRRFAEVASKNTTRPLADEPSVYVKMIGKLKGMVAIALSWVERACSGILDKFPSLGNPVYTGGPSYGAVFCMALVGAAVGAVLYKLYTFIKGKIRTNESFAIYNIRKNRKLNMILYETKIFFDKLDILIENDVMYSMLTEEGWFDTPAHILKTIKGNSAEKMTLSGIGGPRAVTAQLTRQNIIGAGNRGRLTASGIGGDFIKGSTKAAVKTGKSSTQIMGDSINRVVGQVKNLNNDIVRRTNILKDKSKNFLNMINKPKIKPARWDYTQLSNGKILATALDSSGNELMIPAKYLSPNQVPKNAVVNLSPKVAEKMRIAAEKTAKMMRSGDPTSGFVGGSSANYISSLDAGNKAEKMRIAAEKTAKMMRSGDPTSGFVGGSSANYISSLDAGNKAVASVTTKDIGYWEKIKGFFKFGNKSTPKPKSMNYVKMSNGKVLVNGLDSNGNIIAATYITPDQVPEGVAVKLANATNTTTATKAGEVPSKAEGFISTTKEKLIIAWEKSVEWCKNNPYLTAMIGIAIALMVCWFGVKKYREYKEKQQIKV